ncbi:hypothetical protein ATZ36_05300 [Candidatus Endomicrobiellum trichonymphae]|uniref:Lipoprotein n=1 Tax=Endomicrobium trichonymphae TaxID=1408204 RepID=A0A1E5IJX9_ENDTX|nr:hypothetical protein ATZ36_05300 [Candidatus Endomicrobium trichonymphae]
MIMKKVISVYIIFGFLLTSFAGCGKLSEVNSHDLLKNLDEVNRKLDALEKKYTASATKSEGVSPTWTELRKLLLLEFLNFLCPQQSVLVLFRSGLGFGGVLVIQIQKLISCR